MTIVKRTFLACLAIVFSLTCTLITFPTLAAEAKCLVDENGKIIGDCKMPPIDQQPYSESSIDGTAANSALPLLLAAISVAIVGTIIAVKQFRPQNRLL